MLVIKTCLEDLDFDQLMLLYVEGNEENAAVLYPELPKEVGIRRAEQDFYAFLRDKFFQKKDVQYALWEENGEYISALRLEPYRDGLLLEALETKPVYRKMGYASTLMEAVKRVVSKKIYSHVGKWNTASLAIHEKCGFQRILEYVTYADGSVSEKSCTMCLEKNIFWEDCWKQNTLEEYSKYAAKYYRMQHPIVELLKRHNVHYVCDAACGYGAYSIMLASHGFLVEGFDIAPTSVEVTKVLLEQYNFDSSNYKVASVLNTGYDKAFDAVTACSVLDHLHVEDAKNALQELLRIVKEKGIVVISFDDMDEDYLETPHEVTEDGSFLYCDEKRNGMVFHYYSDEELAMWLNQYRVIFTYRNDNGERFFAIQK